MALLLVAFGLFGVVELYMNQAKHITRGRNGVQAACLAQSHLAQLQAAGYAPLDEKIRTHAKESDADQASLFPQLVGSKLGGDFSAFWWNARLRRTVIGELKGIEITVTVQGPGSQGPNVTSKEVAGYVFSP